MKKCFLILVFCCPVVLHGSQNQGNIKVNLRKSDNSNLPAIQLNRGSISQSYQPNDQPKNKDLVSRTRSKSNETIRFINEENAKNFFEQKNKKLHSSSEKM